MARCYISLRGCPVLQYTHTSTRRLRSRPCSRSLSATGSSSPMPVTSLVSTPSRASSRRTAMARRRESRAARPWVSLGRQTPPVPPVLQLAGLAQVVCDPAYVAQRLVVRVGAAGLEAKVHGQAPGLGGQGPIAWRHVGLGGYGQGFDLLGHEALAGDDGLPGGGLGVLGQGDRQRAARAGR